MNVPVVDWPADRPDVPWLNTVPHFAVYSPFDERLIAVAERRFIYTALLVEQRRLSEARDA